MKASGKYDEIVNTYITTSDSDADTSEMVKVEPKKDVYRIASDSAFAPFEFQNEDNEYVGIDVDLMNRPQNCKGSISNSISSAFPERYRRQTAIKRMA